MEPVLVKAFGAPISSFNPRIWNRELSLELNHELKDLEEAYACAWMPLDPDVEETKHPIFAAVGKGGLRVCKEEDGQFVIATGNKDPAISCDWSNGGQYLAVGHKGATVTIWHDAALSGSLKLVGTVTVPHAEKEVISVSWKHLPAEGLPAEGLHLLICGTSDGFMAAIKLESAAAQELAWWKDESNTPLHFVKWLPGDDDSYSGNKNSHFFLYGGFNSLELIRFEMQADVCAFTQITDISGEKHKGSVFGASFGDADGSSFLTWGSDGKIKTWCIKSRPTDESHLILHTPRKDTDLVGSTPRDKMVNGVDWTSPPFTNLEDNYIAVAHEDRSITLCNVRPTLVDSMFHDIGQVGLVLCAHKKSVTCLRWYRGHADKQLRLASSSRDGTVKVWCLWRSTKPYVPHSSLSSQPDEEADSEAPVQQQEEQESQEEEEEE